jgi:hypothetical protein
MSLVTHTPMALEIDRRAFTNGVNDDAVFLVPEPAPAGMTALRRTAIGRHSVWMVVVWLLRVGNSDEALKGGLERSVYTRHGLTYQSIRGHSVPSCAAHPVAFAAAIAHVAIEKEHADADDWPHSRLNTSLSRFSPEAFPPPPEGPTLAPHQRRVSGQLTRCARAVSRRHPCALMHA